MTCHQHRALRTALIGAVAAGSLALATAPASAKSSLTFTAGPRAVRLGGVVHATGKASDDNASFNKVCVQQRRGSAAWHNVVCSKPARHTGGTVNATVRARQRGHLQLRAVLFEGRSPNDLHPRARSVSRTFTVTVR
ncbi:hypothetical protein ADL22_23120 [Streptomyces sp. NRRL F-4489]|uniref:hypothetical protein n=1 Tax=Streptomyces sp. NRRL F-4489 TaxID=1609095 RepID=UPI000748AF25|nr:hypothetical protein [Streptomyces sp. NRRL F-4489]KUL36805.1 hypothetical protein ADL22_23120 [Streptomyces sp. NRRL F-4489]